MQINPGNLTNDDMATIARKIDTRPSTIIIATAARVFGITPHDITGPARPRCYAWPRMAAMALMRKATNLSLPQIGRAFGHRDHTTVLHAIRRAPQIRAADETYNAQCALLEQMVDLIMSDDTEYLALPVRIWKVRKDAVQVTSNAVTAPAWIPRACIHAADNTMIDGLFDGFAARLRILEWKAREAGLIAARDTATGDLFGKDEG